jgi:predicted nucleotidyltransferase
VPLPYHRELAGRLRGLLGAELVGVWAGGSYALGDFDPARSDLDVAAVARGPLAREAKLAVADALRHEALPVPARGLELVVYKAAAVGVPTAGEAFELNLNTGAQIPFRLDLEPGEIERHWFPLDRAILAAHGVAVLGPPAGEVFAPMPRELLLPAVHESLEWHLRRGVSGDDDAVLNACRSLRFLVEGRWSGKGEAGRWALAHVDDRELLQAALAARTRSAQLERERVERFVRAVLARVGAA